ncbi:MAG TPA: hypothetical protein VLM89_05930 [Phycisphaerae bacterium]|nr:hypothetical protein [Phycisphaerae bacterium]
MKRNLGSAHAGRIGLILLTAFTLILWPGLVGCDNPAVQDAVWNGMNDLAGALVDALFLAFKPGSDQTTPVEVSWLTHARPAWIC